jgi:hypothetical protein
LSQVPGQYRIFWNLIRQLFAVSEDQNI